MYFPDNLLYVYKRITTSGSWGSWEKMNARSWDDIQSKPTIPTNTNQLTNGNGFITSAIKESSIDNTAGWCLLHGGLLIQWGTKADTTNEYTVNFHKPYSNIPIVVANYGDNVSFGTPCTVDDIFKTAFEVKHSDSGAWRVNWVAIGRA